MTLTVSDVKKMDNALVNVLGYQKILEEGNQRLYEIAPGGNGGRIIVEEKHGEPSVQGYGTVHHTAFKIAPNSGLVDRFYFKSLYVRLYRPILFELATEGPGFIDDEESLDHLGETLALPPKLRPYRDDIERAVRPILTQKK